MPHSPHIPRHSSPPRKAQGGFALLMTITLLAFLVVLLIGLAAYTRIETAIASNTQRQSQARQNALMALNIAVGQLQKYAGPDQRVTATAEGFKDPASENSANSQKMHYAGVWDTTNPATVPVWLVSGIESGTTEDVTSAIPTAKQVALVGFKSDGSASLANGNPGPNNTVATLQDIRSVGVPGVLSTASPPVIGRYAWWIGDQGVKAPVALGDPTANAANFNFAPYDSAEVLSRIRQQISLGAGPVDATGAPVIEPRDTNNATLVANNKVTTFNQLAFLKTAANAPLGLTQVQKYFHTWSPNNFNVLANTKLGGLRQDLSLDPTLLGPLPQAWLNYTSYLEATDASATVPSGTLGISPPYSADPLRRRYVMQPAPASVSPVLSFFLLSFNVRTKPTASNNPSATPQPVQVRLRGAFTLWNPYSSALVPEDLRLEISGLPASVRLDDTTVGTSSRQIPFASLFGSSIKFKLQWNSGASSGGDDQHSWLPGRTYTWTIIEDISENSPPADGYSCRLNSQDISAVSGDGVIRTIPGLIVDGSDQCHIETNSQTQFTVRLVAPRSGADETLATFVSPRYEAFHTTTRSLGSFTYTPTYVFRAVESDSGSGAWLTTSGVDPHASNVSENFFDVGTVGNANGPLPDQYENVRNISAPDRLLDRDVIAYTYNEDVPVFELPRAPILSLGMLQHLALPGQRPFAIGNSWSMDPAAPVQLNGMNLSELFDRFFFSGLVTNVTPATVGTALQMPNPLLKPLPRNPATSLPVTLADLQAAPSAQTSKFMMQGGAFNINSVDPVAWAAVLRTHRLSAPSSFEYLDADATTGTAADDAVASIQSSDAQFFRFSQSAQETYKAEPGNSGGLAATELFRRGMITVKPDVLSFLAAKITDAIKARHATTGPFRSLEEFLAPTATGSPSLLEQAISDAGVNTAVTEFSSQFLTQGDIMTALAPVLFPRSDTFVIRSYGDAINPTTGAIEGKAWCEATVQRVPDYFDPTNPAETPPGDTTLTDLNKALGRRFKIVSFRWLTRSDI